MPVNGVALSAVGAGVLFVWSGVKGWSVLGTAKELVTGVQPQGTNMYPLSGGNASSGSGVVGGSSSGIAQDALRYQGHPYLYGGSAGTSGNNPWDCSSFCNWVCGHDEKLPIPGMGAGSYNVSFHGPTTVQWAIFPRLSSVSASEVAAGDIIVWPTHMGIAISNTQMISAVDPQEGTKVGPIAGPTGEPIIKRGRY
jgi:cell wall-associated NlpC family hydrolase